MSDDDPILQRLRAIWDALPETEETWPWGSLHVRVAGKIFCGYGAEDGVGKISFKLEQGHAATVVQEARFSPSKYTGKHGWVTFELRGRLPWKRIEAMIGESYRLIAPKKILARLGPPVPDAKAQRRPGKGGARR